MSVTDAMRNIDLADDNLLQAAKDLYPYCENEQIPWELHRELSMLRESVRDLEARIGEHVLAAAEAPDA
jgi:hypothetical protein